MIEDLPRSRCARSCRSGVRAPAPWRDLDGAPAFVYRATGIASLYRYERP